MLPCQYHYDTVLTMIPYQYQQFVLYNTFRSSSPCEFDDQISDVSKALQTLYEIFWVQFWTFWITHFQGNIILRSRRYFVRVVDIKYLYRRVTHQLNLQIQPLYNRMHFHSVLFVGFQCPSNLLYKIKVILSNFRI